MAAVQNASDLPQLPEYSLLPLPPLVPPIPDKVLTLFLPIAAYWILSMLFHWIDEKDYLSQYRLHTPAEVLKRNRVSKWEVVREVVIQQVIQTIVGLALNMTEPDDVYGKEEYDVAVWAKRIRLMEHGIPSLLALLGLDAYGLAKKMGASYPGFAGAIAGGVYYKSDATPWALEGITPGYVAWELFAAKAMYWVLVPAIQFTLGVIILDTWQYFLHRAMHMNKWLYTTFHSRHHRLYVPYAFGALYNHPFEGFLLDTLGAGIAFKLTGMSTRQCMWFFTCSTIKTVDDHCGYALPWDPLQFITSNNAGYHDVHHQSWGIKTNFSQPFFTVWDSLLGTKWTGGDVSARYERARLEAQRKVDQDTKKSVTGSTAAESVTADMGPYANEVDNATLLQSLPSTVQQPMVPAGKAEQQAAGSREQVLEADSAQVLVAEAQEEAAARSALRKSSRRRAASALTPSDGLRGLRERVSIHGRTGALLGMDGQ